MDNQRQPGIRITSYKPIHLDEIEYEWAGVRQSGCMLELMVHVSQDPSTIPLVIMVVNVHGDINADYGPNTKGTHYYIRRDDKWYKCNTGEDEATVAPTGEEVTVNFDAWAYPHLMNEILKKGNNGRADH